MLSSGLRERRDLKVVVKEDLIHSGRIRRSLGAASWTPSRNCPPFANQKGHSQATRSCLPPVARNPTSRTPPAPSIGLRGHPRRQRSHIGECYLGMATYQSPQKFCRQWPGEVLQDRDRSMGQSWNRGTFSIDGEGVRTYILG